MKQLNRLFRSALSQGRGVFLAGVAVLAVLALSSSTPRTGAQVLGNLGNEQAIVQLLAQEAGVLDLLSAYHGALANGGNIDAMALCGLTTVR